MPDVATYPGFGTIQASFMASLTVPSVEIYAQQASLSDLPTDQILLNLLAFLNAKAR